MHCDTFHFPFNFDFFTGVTCKKNVDFKKDIGTFYLTVGQKRVGEIQLGTLGFSKERAATEQYWQFAVTRLIMKKVSSMLESKNFREKSGAIKIFLFLNFVMHYNANDNVIHPQNFQTCLRCLESLFWPSKRTR